MNYFCRPWSLQYQYFLTLRYSSETFSPSHLIFSEVPQILQHMSNRDRLIIAMWDGEAQQRLHEFEWKHQSTGEGCKPCWRNLLHTSICSVCSHVLSNFHFTLVFSLYISTEIYGYIDNVCIYIYMYIYIYIIYLYLYLYIYIYIYVVVLE